MSRGIPSRKILITSLSLSAVLAVLALRAVPEARGDSPQRVLVSNLASPHPVSGGVEIEGTVRHGQMVRFRSLTVSPAGRQETNLLTDAGVLETDGFTRLALSFQGEIKGTPFRPGALGVILLPDEEPILRAFLERGELHLPLETSVEVRAGVPEAFSASAPRLSVTFPRYRVLLYNETDKTAAVNLYAYLNY